MNYLKPFLKVCLTAIVLMLTAFTFAQPTNLALNKDVSGSDPSLKTNLAVDGTTLDNCAPDCNSSNILAEVQKPDGWLQVDLGAVYQIENFKVWNRNDCCKWTFKNLYVLVSEHPFTNQNPRQDANLTYSYQNVNPDENINSFTATPSGGVRGRYVRIFNPGDWTVISEVEVFGQNQTYPPSPQKVNLAAGKTAKQSSTEGSNTADKAVDTDNNSYSKTNWTTAPWWQVDLGNRYSISEISLAIGWENDLKDFFVIFSDNPFPDAELDYEIAELEKYAVKAIRVNQGITANFKVPVSPAVTARYVRIQRRASAGDKPLELKNIGLMGDLNPVSGTPPTKQPWPVNLAAGKASAQSSDAWGGKASHGFDGIMTNETHTEENKRPEWLQVDLGNFYNIENIKIYNRSHGQERLSNFVVIGSDYPFPNEALNFEQADLSPYAAFTKYFNVPGGQTTYEYKPNKPARYIRIQQMDKLHPVTIHEMEVFGNGQIISNHAKQGQDWSGLINSATVKADVEYDKGQIIGIKRPSDGKLCVAWVDAANNNANIKVNTYDPGNNYAKVGSSVSVPNDGELGGFAVDDANNTYVLSIQRAQQNTGKPLVINGTTMNNYCGDMKLYKGTSLLWDADEDRSIAPPDGCPGAINNPGGRARISVGNNKVFVAYQGAANWPWHVVLNNNGTQSIDAKTTLHHHMDGSNIRSMFDGSDFVVVEDRDHDMGITMMKYGAASPITGATFDNVRPIYTHSTYGNGTFTEIGGIAKGLNNGNDGYLVLFASDRDWDYIFDDWSYLPPSSSNYPLKAEPGDIKGWPGSPFTPRDLAVVHVKKNFSDANLINHGYMKNGQRETSWICNVDNSKVINSSGSSKTVTFKSGNDGWDWNNYGCCNPSNFNRGCCEQRDKILDGFIERTITTTGVNWLTSNASAYESGNNTKPSSLPSSHSNFTNAVRPKLVMIGNNTYIAIWEEWTAGSRVNMGTYSTTKAMKITLSGSANEVKVTTGAIQSFPGKRLYQFDDAFELGGKAAWITGDRKKLILHTIDADLKYNYVDLSL